MLGKGVYFSGNDALSLRPYKRLFAALLPEPVKAMTNFRRAYQIYNEVPLAGKGEEKNAKQYGQQSLAGQKDHNNTSQKENKAEDVLHNQENQGEECEFL